MIAALISFVFASYAQKTNAWRGVDGKGIYPDRNLLKEWPAEGPKVLWKASNLGKGFSSPVFAHNKIYLTTMRDTTAFLMELSMDGKLLREISYGPDWYDNFDGARSTPTVAGNMVYALSSKGLLICVDLKDFKIKWQKNLFTDFDGRNIKWGITETILIDGDVLYCAPGGIKNNVIALNRKTGDLIWSCAGKGNISAYCSPVLIEVKGRKFLITMMRNNILSIDAKSGKLVWSYPKVNKYSVHPNTPYFHNNELYCFSGYGSGGLKLSLSEDGTSVTKAWDNLSLDNQMGGVVVIDDHIYGSGQKNRSWQCLDWKTGEQKWESKEIGKGVIIAADNMLYLYSDKGDLALIEANPNAFVLKGKISIDFGEAYHWAHPVIHKGILYVRHGSEMVAYDIKS
jgi:outer membrane protein assembly factor BamB